MPKEFNPFHIVGIVLGVILGQLVFNSIGDLSEAPARFVLIMNLLITVLSVLMMYLVVGSLAYLIKQEETITIYRVKTLKLIPKVQEERESLNHEEVLLSFRLLPAFQLEYYVTPGTIDFKELRYAQVIETNTTDMLYKVSSWQYKQPWHRFVQYQRATREFLVIPNGKKLYDN